MIEQCGTHRIFLSKVEIKAFKAHCLLLCVWPPVWACNFRCCAVSSRKECCWMNGLHSLNLSFCWKKRKGNSKWNFRLRLQLQKTKHVGCFLAGAECTFQWENVESGVTIAVAQISRRNQYQVIIICALQSTEGQKNNVFGTLRKARMEKIPIKQVDMARHFNLQI